MLLPAMPGWGLGALTLGGLFLCLWRGRWRHAGWPAIALGLASAALASPSAIAGQPACRQRPRHRHRNNPPSVSAPSPQPGIAGSSIPASGHDATGCSLVSP